MLAKQPKLVNFRGGPENNTLLIYAVENSKGNVVELLLKKGADKNLKNKAGKTAVDLAQKKPNIIKILNKF